MSILVDTRRLIVQSASMTQRKKRKRTNRGVNLPPDVYAQIEQYKIETGVPIARFVLDAVKAALAK